MKKITTINGSSRPNENNAGLLRSLEQHFSHYHFSRYHDLSRLPLFTASADKAPWPVEVLEFRASIAKADGVIISTPEYIHNIPAVLKNALEWITSSGELFNKPTLAVTYCPHAPRGDKAMTSLLQSLQALSATVKLQIALYQNEFVITEDDSIIDMKNIDLMSIAIDTLWS